MSASSQEFSAVRLPRLLYVADVPVESSYHGSALLYRLLQNYPADALRIVETGPYTSTPKRRLARANYRASPIHSRWLNTRFNRYVSIWLSLQAARFVSTVADQLGNFQPEAVITVAHGYGWLVAARLAQHRGLPLHLIVHDDWPRAANLPPPFGKWLDRQFGRIYRQSASRLCVSQFMREDYQARYCMNGTVLYPSRASDCPNFHAPPERLRQVGRPLTGAYGGSINSEGYARALRRLAKSLDAGGGRLQLFGPSSPVELKHLGLSLPNVDMRGLVKFPELIEHCRVEADFLFAPMSFDLLDRDNMKLSFPSKLADYTAAGLPLLICGPSYCSAVRWAKENPGVAEVVESEEPAALRDSLVGLAEDPARRFGLAKRALELGRQFFSHATVEKIFYSALAGHEVHKCSLSA